MLTEGQRITVSDALYQEARWDRSAAEALRHARETILLPANVWIILDEKSQRQIG